MADKAKTPVDTGDDELAAAFANLDEGGVATELAPESGTQAQTDPDGDALDHKESSRLGRKIKGFEAELERMRVLLESKTNVASTNAMDEDADPEMLERLEEKRRLDAYERGLEAKKYQAYQADYRKMLAELGAENEDMHEDILALMTSNNFNNEYNIVYGKGAAADAAKNYGKALKAVMMASAANGKPVIPVKGANTKPAGPSGSSTQAAKATPGLADLDKNPNQELIAHMRRNKFTDEEIAAAMR